MQSIVCHSVSMPASIPEVRFKQQAEWLGGGYSSSAASLREGLEETSTVNALGPSAALRRCLATTNIESPQAGVRQRTHRVTRWTDGGMALRWAVPALGETKRHFCRIMCYHQLWLHKSYLDATDTNTELAAARRAG